VVFISVNCLYVQCTIESPSWDSEMVGFNPEPFPPPLPYQTSPRTHFAGEPAPSPEY
jgi:hypothetical protein